VGGPIKHARLKKSFAGVESFVGGGKEKSKGKKNQGGNPSRQGQEMNEPMDRLFAKTKKRTMKSEIKGTGE